MRVLLIVVAVLSTACAATGAHPNPFPRPGGRPSLPSQEPRGSGDVDRPRTVSADAYEVSGTALALRGAPYRNGGTDPNGFDCSGLVWYVFAQHGVSLPRRVEDQFRAGGTVTSPDLRPGDLVFFNTAASGATHVGIAVGGDSFIHAPSSNGVVRVDRLGAVYWASRFIGARRVLR